MRDRYRLSGIVKDAAQLSRFERFIEPAGLVTGGRVTPNWLPDGASFWYASDAGEICRVDGVTGEITPLSEPIDVPDGDGEAPRSFLRATWLMEPRPVAELPSPDRQWFARLAQGNIVLRPPGSGDRILTTDGDREFGWDIEAPLFEPSSRDPWSPDGAHLFAIKFDRRGVPSFPLVDPLDPTAPSPVLKVQLAGGPIDIAYPHVIDVKSGRVQPLALGDTRDQFFILIGWLPDGSEVIFARYSRDFRRVEVLAGNPADGSVRTVIAETADTFVAHQHEVIYYGRTHATILPDGSGIIWRSARSGWQHFYLYGVDGTLRQALTTGMFPVIDMVGFDPDEEWVYFTAHPDQARPYDTHLCRVPIIGGAVERLTPHDGQNQICLSPSHKTFTVVNSRPDRPYRSDFHARDGTHLATIEQADVTALTALGCHTPEEFTVLAADGVTELWGVIHKPADFDPTKTYPLIDHLYGGAQTMHVDHSFGPGANSRKWLDRALAQLGYVVISLDARGTPERSKAFQDVVHGNVGRHEIPDHVAAIRQLAARHAWIDLDRVGVWGHSMGGYFAIRALAQAPELFRAAVAAAPAPDTRYAFFGEPYLGLPDRNAEAYDYADLARWLPTITGKLLIAVGTADPLLNGIKLTQGLIDAGIDHEFVVLPGAQHSFTGANDRYFIRKLVAHFATHLKGADD